MKCFDNTISFKINNKNYELNVLRCQSEIYFLKADFGKAKKMLFPKQIIHV